MAATTRNICIVGATGLIGSHIACSILGNKSDFGRIVVFTCPETVNSKSEEINKLRARGAEIITGSIEDENDINKAFSNIDTVVSAVGRPVIDKQLKLIEVAEKHPDVKRFLPSEYGTDIEYDETSVNEKPHQLKLKVRAFLKTVHSLEYTYVVTGPYGDGDSLLYLAAKAEENEEEGTFDVRRKRVVLLGDGNGKISLTTMRDVGKLVVAALRHPEGCKNKAIRVNSFTTTPRELLEEFQRQTGQEWSVSYTSLDRLRELEEEAWKQGLPRAGTITLRRIWTSGKTLYEQRDNHLVEAESGLDNVESAVRQAIEVQNRKSK